MLTTGIAGYLTFSTEAIHQFGLFSVHRRTFEPTNGEIFDFETYLVSMSWHGRTTYALVLKSDSTSRLAMSLLCGSQFVLNAMDDGEATIEEMDAGE